jgi:hypothetical protein
MLLVVMDPMMNDLLQLILFSERSARCATRSGSVLVVMAMFVTVVMLMSMFIGIVMMVMALATWMIRMMVMMVVIFVMMMAHG